MKVLITGITGLLGSYLAREFAGLGILHGLKRKQSKLDLLGDLSTEVTWHEGDINDFQSLEAAFKDVDIVIHAAGLVPVDLPGEGDLLKVNLEGTTNVVNALLSTGIKRLVFISSASALGIDPDTDIINEQYKWTTSDLNSPYAVSKHLAELEVWRGAQEGLEVMVFNPTTLLPKISDCRSSAHIYQYLLKSAYGSNAGNFNYSDIRDASALIAKLVKDGEWNSRYIISNGSIPFPDLLVHLREAFKSAPVNELFPWRSANSWKSLLPFFLKRKTYGKFDGLNGLIAGKPLVYENKKAAELSGFSFRPLTETLRWASGNESKSIPV
ncbi:NAD-dependent epimerase/dehydratase family protein [Lunatimonas salinarum]|uniref:NAD-dependent epimerase/dehydratase family protein n=1 Tax=Lunatimonas salinarum TaxID=1774590 RepID=UPI001ADEE8B5|nr:NAD-dependent epimerase/dehydratase family protein [Lunatimonas salinarum]